MYLSNVTVNEQSSIKIVGTKVVYFDAFKIAEEKHDADIVFITHEHYDHFDVESIAKITKADTLFVAPKSMQAKVLASGICDEEHCCFVNPNAEYEFLGLKVKTIPAYNLIKPFHMKHCGWVGYVVTLDDITYYVAGDTDANEDNAKVKCDVAFLPVGGKYTMNKEQAAAFAQIIMPKVVVPTHYGEVVGAKTDGEDFKKIIENGETNIIVEIKL